MQLGMVATPAKLLSLLVEQCLDQLPLLLVCVFFFISIPASKANDTFTSAPLPRPTILMATSPSPTSITLTWEQTEGADAVDSYEINYQYIVKQCIGEGGSFPAITVMEINGSLRSYTLTNSALTPVEEDSLFSISLTAVNDVEMSASSESAMTATAEAGTIICSPWPNSMV